MARDPFERRDFTSTTPDDVQDAPRFGRIVEATKNAFVWELREFFDQSAQTTERLAERPRIEKYNFGFGVGLDPYETVVAIVRKRPDVLEALPHIAVLSADGSWKPLGFGPPMLGAVQDAPRIQTTAEPFALVAGPTGVGDAVSAPAAEAVTLTDATGPFLAGHVGQQIHVSGMANGVNNGTFVITSVPVATEAVFVNADGVAETFPSAGRWLIGTQAMPSLYVRSTPGGVVKTDRVVFRPIDFPTAAPITAAAVTDIVRIYNTRALWTHAMSVDLGGGNTGVRILPGGPAGGWDTPNLVEVAVETDDVVLTAMGLGTQGTGDSMTFSGSTVVLTDAAGLFVAADIGRYVTITGATEASNNGRFLVTAQTATTLSFTNPDGQAETFAGDWFIGVRDDWDNAARPPRNRYVLTWDLSVTVQVLAEDENIRTDLIDLVLSFFTFHLEERYFTLLGRSVLDETVADEKVNIVIKPGVRAGSEQEIARPDDARDAVYAATITVDVQTSMYIDRDVEHPSVAGTPWTVRSTDITYDNTDPGNAVMPGSGGT